MNLLLAGWGLTSGEPMSSVNPPPRTTGEIALRVGATGGIPPTQYVATELPM